MSSESNGAHFMSEEEFSVDDEGNYSLVLRFKNCTGNIINFSDKRVPTQEELQKAEIALSIDKKFYDNRHRQVK